jgi:hypothetical protein
MKRILIVITLCVVMLPAAATAKRLHPKRWYQERWCAKYFSAGPHQVTNVYDCLTPEYVVEFDYANHWYESIGESLHYAMQTGKKAGIVLIMEKEKDLKYWVKLNETINHYHLPIRTWRTSP